MLPRVLIIHNHYRIPGGEDTVVANEAALLRAFGHEVEEYYESNDTRFGFNELVEMIWSRRARSRLREVIARFQPDVIHCHNIYYRISPSVYWLARELGLPVVQTLHNFRFRCLNAKLSRKGEPCERCLTGAGTRLNGVVRRCFQKSWTGSLALALSNGFHEAIGSFSRPVTRFIALSDYAREKHVMAGIPPRKLVVKYNCVYPDVGRKTELGSYCILAGRLEAEKGIRVVLQAASLIPDIPIVIAGNGPLGEEVRHAASAAPNVRYLGQVAHGQMIELMKSARLLLFPSVMYENFPMTIAEAFSVGLPVVASRRGAAAEIVEDRINGLLFNPGSAADLSRQVRKVWADEYALLNMGNAARRSYEQNCSGEQTYRMLSTIYRNAIADPRGINPIRDCTQYISKT
jgi:glycosyltransferase involved in cell wall biosynthesis